MLNFNLASGRAAGKAGEFVFTVGKAFLKPGLKLSEEGKLYSTIIPIPPVNLTANINEAYTAAKQMLTNNSKEFESKVKLLKDDAGNIIKDADGNVHGEIEVTLNNGSTEKVEVLLNEDEAKLKQAADEIDIEQSAFKFTQAQLDEYVRFATKNPDAKKVMLGMWDNGAATSYVNKAGKEYTYFSMGDEWDKAKALVNNNDDEMWRINKQFIDEQHKAGKEFWFSHDPYSPKNDQSFAREINYLIDVGVKDFKKTDNLWEAIW